MGDVSGGEIKREELPSMVMTPELMIVTFVPFTRAPAPALMFPLTMYKPAARLSVPLMSQRL